MHRRALPVSLLLTGLLLGLVAPLAAPAAAQAPEGAILLIMDASGSMEARDPDGVRLMDGAKEALRGVVDSLPEGTHVGLRAYGHREPNTDPVRGCQDTELISPVQPLDRGAMHAAIDALEPSGFTPIGLALEQGAGDLPPEGPRTIVLVSDGEDTCAPPDPCEVAAGLRGDGVDLVVETVGFALGGNDEARTQLQCIADAGGGEFRDIATAAELVRELEVISNREARRFAVAGDAVEGGAVPAQAPDIPANGTVTDTIVLGEILYYRVPLDGPGSLRALITRAGVEGASGRPQLRVEITNDAGAAVHGGTVRIESESLSQTGMVASRTVELDDSRSEVYVKVELGGARNSEVSEFPLQIDTTFEPAEAPEPEETEPEEAEETEPPEVEETEEPADDDGDDGDGDEELLAADGVGADGLPTWAAVVMTLLVVLVIGLAVLVGILFKRTSTPRW